MTSRSTAAAWRTIAAGTVIFLGEGPARISSTVDNPAARGIKLTVTGSGATLRRIGSGSGAKWALDITGSLQLLGFRGVTGTATSGNLRINTTGTAIGGFGDSSEVLRADHFGARAHGRDSGDHRRQRHDSPPHDHDW